MLPYTDNSFCNWLDFRFGTVNEPNVIDEHPFLKGEMLWKWGLYKF